MVTLSLLGILPIEVVIHKNALNLFMNILHEKDTVEYEIAERQLAMKDNSEKSWFNYIKEILDLYSMPSIFSLFEQEFSKSEWKELMNQSINSSVEAVWKSKLSLSPP